MTTDLPARIKPDAILEALFEIRFGIEELPEVFLGRVLTSGTFQNLERSRLPQADIPVSARESDPKFRFQPLYQLQGERELVRVGTDILSLHILPPYCGWADFEKRATEIIGEIWNICKNLRLERCGLRYINALTADAHNVRNIEDLNLVVSVAGENLIDVTVSFLAEDDENTETLVRVASVKHVQGDVPDNATFVVDVDVRTTGDIQNWKSVDVIKWINSAHTIEKKHFFDLLPDRIIDPLKD